MTLSSAEVAAYYRHRLPTLNQRGNQWRGPCPIHDGRRHSFSVNSKSGAWCCHSECGRAGAMTDLEMEVSGCGFETAAKFIAEKAQKAAVLARRAR